ncbi:MAG: sulfatase-like hydrolase/transferase, partial [Thermoanaerobaculia bacterium]|nr:sulfatase-like hydrolase/transferase [Thermoanaerobaculia bacterium]
MQTTVTGVLSRAVGRTLLFTTLGLGVLAGCGEPSEDEAVAISLVDRFDEATVTGAPEAVEPPAPIEWDFGEAAGDEASENDDGILGWRALHGIDGLRVRDGRLVGETGETPLLVVKGLEDPDPSDFFHSLEIEMRVSEGTRLGVEFEGATELDEEEEEEIVEAARDREFLGFNRDLSPGDDLQTYRITSADASFNTSVPLRRLRHIVIRPTEAEDATFEIASMRVVSLKEHLATVPSGVGWHGLGDVFRETIVARAPERIAFDLSLPSRPFLDLSIGTFDHGPVTFAVEVDGEEGHEPLLRRTVSRAQEWQTVPVDLKEYADREVTLTLALHSEHPGTIGFWGAPVLRNRGGELPTEKTSSAARNAVVGAEQEPPQGVILIVADTLRRDQFQPFGYERPNAPNLTRLAREGALFRDAIAQGSWTKVSVSSLITSLY